MERENYLLQHLKATGIEVTLVPIANSKQADVLVRFSPSGPYTVFSAHYDKLYQDPNYEGASDNTAAVSVLLASAEELARNFRGKVAFLFTGEEETGLRGAVAFVEYVRTNGLEVRENVNLDNIGRGRLAIRPLAATPGYVFSIPFYGDWVYDGRRLGPSRPYSLANARLTQALEQVDPGLVVFQRFTALSDSNVFQDVGMDTVSISGDDMRYLELTWHTYDDRVELLDEQNLDLALDLVTGYARQLEKSQRPSAK